MVLYTALINDLTLHRLQDPFCRNFPKSSRLNNLLGSLLAAEQRLLLTLFTSSGYVIFFLITWLIRLSAFLLHCLTKYQRSKLWHYTPHRSSWLERWDKLTFKPAARCLNWTRKLFKAVARSAHLVTSIKPSLRLERYIGSRFDRNSHLLEKQ